MNHSACCAFCVRIYLACSGCAFLRQAQRHAVEAWSAWLQLGSRLESSMLGLSHVSCLHIRLKAFECFWLVASLKNGPAEVCCTWHCSILFLDFHMALPLQEMIRIETARSHDIVAWSHYPHLHLLGREHQSCFTIAAESGWQQRSGRTNTCFPMSRTQPFNLVWITNMSA